MKKLNTRKLKKLYSMLIWKKKRKNMLGLSLSFDMDHIESEEDIKDVIKDAVRTLNFIAKKEWRIFIRTELTKPKED